jgi:TIR domain
MPAQVFISYSSKSPKAVRLRDALHKELETAGYTVFIDNWELSPGDAWRRKIRLALAECHAGIILFSNTALQNSWVLYEASIFSFRSELDSQFKLIPVLLEDVEPCHLEAERFSPLALSEVQRVRVSKPARIVQQIRNVLGRAVGREKQGSPLDVLTNRIELELVHLHHMQLRDVAIQLGASCATWSPDQARQELSRVVARLAIQDGMEGVCRVITAMAPVLRSKQTRILLDLLAPLWVQQEVAGRISKIADRPAPPWSVGLNGKRVSNFTAGMYVQRAYWPKPPGDVFRISGGWGEDLLGHVRQELMEHVQRTRNYSTPEEANDYLKATRARVFVTLPVIPDSDALDELRAAYPNLTFILSTGETCPGPDHPMPPRVEVLPRLDLKEEQQAWVGYGDAMGLINQFP